MWLRFVKQREIWRLLSMLGWIQVSVKMWTPVFTETHLHRSMLDQAVARTVRRADGAQDEWRWTLCLRHWCLVLTRSQSGCTSLSEFTSKFYCAYENHIITILLLLSKFTQAKQCKEFVYVYMYIYKCICLRSIKELQTTFLMQPWVLSWQMNYLGLQ